ncbi:CBS domain-containing protein [Actinomarinicola tropica]|uniref:CBS domain-containing protein n=1 Tax=Actinomarinicola tropica TaxID=2789776 RepID=A0A5Q2RMH0_9ACTN|nr:CBS domain-containing protein [Actinomarinicola tropica]QGG96142.1 CBS domain-containing protein [Actinomarinicola tropica]
MLSTANPIATVMRRTTVTVRLGSTLREISEVLTREEVGAVVVKGAQPIAGIVSERDVVRALAEGADPDEERAEDVMTFEVVTVAPDESLAEVGRRMVDGGIRHLPVVEDGVPVGIVSIRDLLAADSA